MDAAPTVHVSFAVIAVFLSFSVFSLKSFDAVNVIPSLPAVSSVVTLFPLPPPGVVAVPNALTTFLPGSADGGGASPL